MAELAYPIKLDDKYPCRGRDANGEQVHWDDLLSEGDITGPGDDHGDTSEARVVRGYDGLWVIWDPSVQREIIERDLASVPSEQEARHG